MCQTEWARNLVPNEFRNIFISTVFWPCPGDLERHQSTVIVHHWKGGVLHRLQTWFVSFSIWKRLAMRKANSVQSKLGASRDSGSLFQDGEVFLCELGRSSNKKHLFLFVSCICLPRPGPQTLWTGQEILVEPKLHPACSQAAMLQPVMNIWSGFATNPYMHQFCA